MRPITFACVHTLPLAPEDIAGQMLDLANWTTFTGYGPLPGVRAAEFEARTPGVVGTRIRVTNTDGSAHVERIAEWDPGRRLRLDMTDFAPPLSRLATGFEERWEFERAGGGTRVVRSFRLHPKSRLARPALWLISLLLRRAVARHLRRMWHAGRGGGEEVP
jgi:hypothetical protein